MAKSNIITPFEMDEGRDPTSHLSNKLIEEEDRKIRTLLGGYNIPLKVEETRKLSVSVLEKKGMNSLTDKNYSEEDLVEAIVVLQTIFKSRQQAIRSMFPIDVPFHSGGIKVRPVPNYETIDDTAYLEYTTCSDTKERKHTLFIREDLVQSEWKIVPRNKNLTHDQILDLFVTK